MILENEWETVAEKAVNSIAEGDTDMLTQWFRESVWPSVISFGIRVILVIALFLIGRKIIQFIGKIADKSFEKVGMELTLRKFVKYIINFVCYCLLILLLIMAAGKDAASFAAVFSSAWVALGLSLQGSLTNFAGGILIMIFKPFKVGDYIVECSGKNEGFVTSIGLVYSEILMPDSKKLVIPNGNLANNSIINVTAMGKRRVDVKAGIAYSADLQKAKLVAKKVLEQNAYLLKEEDKVVYIDDLADSSVVVGLRGWAKCEDYFNALWSITEEIKLAFDEAGVEIPFNQIDVHMK